MRTVKRSIRHPRDRHEATTEPTQHVSWSFAPTELAPRGARDAIRALLAGVADPAPLYDAELLLTELVTNSVRHGGLRRGDSICVDVAIRGDELRVEVVDAGRGEGGGAKRRDRDEGGRGLRIVRALSSEWGFERRPVPRAWFRMPLKGTGSSDMARAG